MSKIMMNNNMSSSHASLQGNKFKALKEGFETNNPLIEGTQKVLNNAKSASVENQQLASLQKQYDDALKEYNTLADNITNNADKYINRVNPTNKYLNKLARFRDGKLCYITNQGVLKYIPSTEILNSTNIPKNNPIDLNLDWNAKYSVAGTQIPTTPPLMSGTPVANGQTFGNEGTNVYVNEFIPANIVPTYMGCYNPSEKNDNMTFIGGVPPKEVSITNGDFALPALKNNTFKFIDNSSEVSGWTVERCVLINSFTIGMFPVPYPTGAQCIGIQRDGKISTLVNLMSGVEYSLSFYACGSECCDKSKTGNFINIKLHTTADAFIKSVATLTPAINTWTRFTYKFTAPTSNTYRLYFTGTSSATVYKISAIQGISITHNAISSGSFTINQCMNASASQGYQYFALQDIEPQSSKGYCAVSNSNPEITRYGIAKIPTKTTILWSSKTGGITGGKCVLSATGSLQVIDGTDKVIYASPSLKAVPNNYLGCYADNATSRSMTVNNTKIKDYPILECNELAANAKYSLFGVQTTSRGTMCLMSNEIDTATKYGIATNCTKLKNGKSIGGALSNAIYNTNLPTSHYYLILKDDGSMILNRGKGPDDFQGEIFNFETTSLQKEANPQMKSSAGKYGKNWLNSGDTLVAGDYVSSPSGNITLMMNPDGNLVLITYELEDNCKIMSDGKKGGGKNANAVYDIGLKSVPENMGKLAYIDENSNLLLYPNENKAYNTTYTTLNRLDTTGNDLLNAPLLNSTVQSCKNICNARQDCAGFVFDNSNNKCIPKNNKMYPYSQIFNSTASSDIYVRNINPKILPKGVPSNTSTVDTIKFSRYTNAGNIGNKTYGISNINFVEKQQLSQIQSRLDMLSSQINKITNTMSDGTQSINNQSKINATGVSNYMDDMKSVEDKIQQYSGESGKSANLQNLLNDTDIVTLQRNYEYLFWSILATGTVLVAINVVKN